MSEGTEASTGGHREAEEVLLLAVYQGGVSPVVLTELYLEVVQKFTAPALPAPRLREQILKFVLFTPGA